MGTHRGRKRGNLDASVPANVDVADVDAGNVNVDQLNVDVDGAHSLHLDGQAARNEQRPPTPATTLRCGFDIDEPPRSVAK